MTQVNHRKAIINAFFLVFSLLLLITVAEAHDGNQSITSVHACVVERSGRVRIVSVDGECSNNEVATHWSLVGPAGRDGKDADPAKIDALQSQINTLEEKIDSLQAFVDELHPPALAIGDTGPAGGIVFYVTNGGLSGLEAAPVDQAVEAEWGCPGLRIVGFKDTTGFPPAGSIGNGKPNTATITNECPEVGIAPQIATKYVSPTGETDWFLPSIAELGLMHDNLHINGLGGFVDDFYWSSSKNNSLLAWSQNFRNGNQGSNFKVSKFRVRAVRAF